VAAHNDISVLSAHARPLYPHTADRRGGRYHSVARSGTSLRKYNCISQIYFCHRRLSSSEVGWIVHTPPGMVWQNKWHARTHARTHLITHT